MIQIDCNSFLYLIFLFSIYVFFSIWRNTDIWFSFKKYNYWTALNFEYVRLCVFLFFLNTVKFFYKIHEKFFSRLIRGKKNDAPKMNFINEK